MANKHLMYFNEELHKYTDDLGNPYTSTTQLLHKYIPEFDTKGTALRCSRSPKSKYYGWNVDQIMKDWKDITKISLDIGNKTHNYLENNIKAASRYHKVTGEREGSFQIYTVEDVLDDIDRGNCDLDTFREFDMHIKYPKVYRLLEILVSQGWRMFAEVCVFHKEFLISGLLDLLLINPDLGMFITGDWKTGKHSLTPYNDPNNKWKSGYYVKDSLGRQTAEYRFTEQYMNVPLHSFQSSTYVHYMFQTGIYTYLTKRLSNLENKGILLCHINEHIKDVNNLATVNFYDVDYYEESIIELLNDFNKRYNKQQLTLAV